MCSYIPVGKSRAQLVEMVCMHLYACTYMYVYMRASQVALVVKNLSANAGDLRDAGLIPGSGRCPGGGHGNPLQVFLPGESHGQRSLAGYNPWGSQNQTQLK